MASEELPPFPTRFGWVGLGAMGFPMAEQLRRKIPNTCVLWVYDLNHAATTKFLEQEVKFDAERGHQGAQVGIGSCSRDIAEKSVGISRND